MLIDEICTMLARRILVRCLSEKQAAVRLVSCHARRGYGLSNAVGPGPIPALGAARHARAESRLVGNDAEHHVIRGAPDLVIRGACDVRELVR